MIDDDGNMHRFGPGERDEMFPGKMQRLQRQPRQIMRERRSELDDEDIEGSVIIVGPDGERHQLNLGDAGMIRGFAMGAAPDVAMMTVVADDDDDDFDTPLAQDDDTIVEGAHVIVKMNQNDGHDSYSITIEDGDISAEVNGKKWPDDQIRRRGGLVQLLDDDGDVLAEFHVAGPNKAARGLGRSMVGEFGGAMGGGMVSPFQLHMDKFKQMGPPKVMVGITMGTVDEDLADQLDLDPDDVILITRVLDGLPADKAGLREGDIITEIDGEEPVSPIMLREVLQDKEPGDELTLTVIRKGREREIEVKLKKWDPKKMGMPAGQGMIITGRGPMFNEDDMNFGFDTRDLPEEARREFERAFKEARRLGRQRGGMGAIRRDDKDNGRMLWLEPRFGPDRLRGDSDMANQMKDRVRELDERVNELDERMDEINERLKKLDRKLDRLLDKLE
jgi:hypothetical protein